MPLYSSMFPKSHKEDLITAQYFVFLYCLEITFSSLFFLKKHVMFLHFHTGALLIKENIIALKIVFLKPNWKKSPVLKFKLNSYFIWFIKITKKLRKKPKTAMISDLLHN